MIDREVHAAGTPAFMVILLHRHADGQIVDDRDHFAQVLGEQTEEQHLVAVVQGSQVDVLTERIRQPLVLVVGAPDLRFQGADVRREQTREAQRLPFLRGERRALVEQRCGQHRHSSRLGLVTAVPVDRVIKDIPVGGLVKAVPIELGISNPLRQYRNDSLSHCDPRSCLPSPLAASRSLLS